MTTKATQLTPYAAFHPGELIKDELEYRNIPQSELANKIGLSASSLNKMLNGKRPLTPELALTMEAVLGVNADMLVRMQSDYDIYQMRHNSTFMSKLNTMRKVAAMF